MDLAAYSSTWVATAALGVWALLQVLLADVVAIRAKHVPGAPPAQPSHDDPLFRVARAHANTLENLPLYVLGVLAAVGLGASPAHVGMLCWVFFAARIAHGLAYYADLRLLRSVAFGVSLLPVAGLLIVGFF